MTTSLRAFIELDTKPKSTTHMSLVKLYPQVTFLCILSLLLVVLLGWVLYFLQEFSWMPTYVFNFEWWIIKKQSPLIFHHVKCLDLSKACLEALPNFPHVKCLDLSNFVLHFVKRSFMPPRLPHNPWHRVCGHDVGSQIWDLMSSSFQPRPSKYMMLKFCHQSLRCWMHLSLSTFFSFNRSYTECTFT